MASLMVVVALAAYAAHMWLLFAGATVAWLLIYPMSCWLWPWANCWCCGGKGRHYREDRKVHRDCKRVCKGTGKRLRVGRRIWNRYHGKAKR